MKRSQDDVDRWEEVSTDMQCPTWMRAYTSLGRAADTVDSTGSYKCIISGATLQLRRE